MRIFVGHYLPIDKALKYKLSIAGCNFCCTLIEGKGFDRTFSILPTFVHGRVKGYLDMEGLVFSRFREKIIDLKILTIIHENLKIFKKIPNGSNVWLYNVTILNTLLYLMIRFFKRRTRIFVILLDYTPKTNLLQRLYLWQINHADGVIKLADSTLFANSNSKCIPGITPGIIIPNPILKSINSEFLLSGVINENIAMISKVLSVFSKTPDMILHITGNFNDMELIEKYAGCDNIIYHGQMENADYLDLLHHVSFVLSTRNPGCAENRCNFPSKIIEAFLHNRIVISTIEYKQIEELKYFVVSSTEETMEDDILNIVNKEDSILMTYANQNEKVYDLCNVGIWNQYMIEIEGR